jgi:hypothetical protein
MLPCGHPFHAPCFTEAFAVAMEQKRLSYKVEYFSDEKNPLHDDNEDYCGCVRTRLRFEYPCPICRQGVEFVHELTEKNRSPRSSFCYFTRMTSFVYRFYKTIKSIILQD